MQIVGSEKLVRIGRFKQELVKKGGNCLAACIPHNQTLVLAALSSNCDVRAVLHQSDVSNERECGDFLGSFLLGFSWTKHTCYDLAKVKEKESLGNSLEVVDLAPGTAYTLLLWRENRSTFSIVSHDNNEYI